MIFKLECAVNPKLQVAYDLAMRELGEFFEINWTRNRPRVFIVKNRATIEALWEEKSEPWQIGWSEPSGIYVLDQETMEQESSHKKYSDEKYAGFIKHELSHSFSRIISKVGNKEILPKWIWEGVAVYTSGELMKKEKPVKFSKFLEYYKKHDKNIYEESGFVVSLLIQKFGKNKFLELLTRLTEATTEDEFGKLFLSIYGIKLSYGEINKL